MQRPAPSTVDVGTPTKIPGVRSGRRRPGAGGRTRCAAALLLAATYVGTPQALRAQDGDDGGFFNSWLDGLSMHGEARFRPIIQSNYDFNKHTNDTSDRVEQRIQFGLQKDLGQKTRLRITAQDSRLWGASPGSDRASSTANDATDESLDVREAWLESLELIGPLGFRAGRQILDYGDSRLVSVGNWSNTGRSFDALRLQMDTPFWKMHAWGAVLAEEDDGGSNTSVGRQNSSGISFQCDETGQNCSVIAATPRELDDAYFAGFYNTLRWAADFHTDVYYLGRYRKWIPARTARFPLPGAEVTTERERQRDNLHTVGTRWTNRTHSGKADAPYDYDVEIAWQRGETGETIADPDAYGLTLPRVGLDGQILRDANGAAQTEPVAMEAVTYDTRALALKGGWTWSFAKGTLGPVSDLRLGAEYVEATGDPDRTDAAAASFDPLFAANHRHLGQMDLQSWRNVRAKSLNLTVFFGALGQLQLSYWRMDKHRLQDAWYGRNGVVQEAPTTESRSNARFGDAIDASGVESLAAAKLREKLFEEYDLRYSLKVRGLRLRLGYSIAFGGDSIRAVRDQIYAPIDQRRPSFDPRAQFAYISLQGTF